MNSKIKKSLFAAVVIMGFSFCVGQINQFQMTSNGVSESQIDADSYNGVGGVVYTRSGGIYYRYGLGAEEFVGTGEIARLAIDSSGNAHVAYINGGNMYYNYFDGDWNNEIPMLLATGISEVDIDTDSSNNAHFIFRGRYYDDSAYWTASDDVVYITYSGGTFNYIKGWNGYYEYLGGADGYGYYYTSYPLNINIDTSDNYHLTFWSRAYSKWMGGTDNTYNLNHDTNIVGGNSNVGGNIALYKNGLTTIGTSAYGLYTSPFKVASLNGAWNDNSAWEAGTPNLASDGTNLGLAYIAGTDLKYAIANGTTFGSGSTIATGATEVAFTMSDGKFFVYYLKSDGVDNEIYLQTDAVMDTTPPTINITYPTNGTRVNGDAIIQFTGTELDSPECSIDNTNWVSCTNGVTKLSEISGFNDLGQGNFTLYMTETDLAGNTGTQNEAGIIKDTIAPIEIISGTVIPSTFYAIFSGLVFYDIDFNYDGGLLYYGTGNNTGDLMTQSMTGINFSMIPDPYDTPISNYWKLENLTMEGLISNSPYNYFYRVFDSASNEFVSQIYNFTTLPDPVQVEFMNIDATLSGNGIISNLEQVNSFNISSFSGLFFEKPDYGKVTFSGNLDLTDPNTQNFLYSLEQYLDMNLGHLNFELTGTILASYGATIQFYLESEIYPNGPLSMDKIVVRDDLGNSIDASTIISGLNCYSVSVGNIEQICEFDTEHFTSFDLIPELVYVNIYSNNPYDNNTAKVGDTVFLQFAGSENLNEMDVNIGGKQYSLGEVSLTGGGVTWTASLVLTEDINEGTIPFEITYQDLYGNDGTAVINTTNSSEVIFDKTNPTANIYYTISTPTNQSLYAILTGYSENISITNNGGSSTYFFTGNGTFTFEFVDGVGNTGTATATVDWIDKIKPTAIVEYNPSLSTYEDVLATLTGASEQITITNNGGNNQYLFTDNGDFTFEFEDAVGNTGATNATVDWIDRVNPTADIHYSYTGITNQDVIASLTGMSENITMTNNGGNFSYTFTGNGSFTFEFQDAAGNGGSATATVSNIDKVKPNTPILNTVDTLIGSNDIIIEGVASEGYQISFYINDSKIDTMNLSGYGITYNSGTREFSFSLSNGEFNEGENTFALSESDEAGNESTKTSDIIITKDTLGPVISNDYITDITSNGANLYFDFEDANLSDGNWTGYVEVNEVLLRLDDSITEDRRSDYEFPISLNLNTGKGSAIFSGLDPQRSYRYNIYIDDDLGNTGDNDGYFETASNPVNLDNTTYQGITTFTGTVEQGEEFNLSGFNIIVQSNPNNFQHGLSGALVLSGVSSFTISGSSWNGILMPPTSVLPGYDQFGNIEEFDLDAEFGSGTEENSQVLGTFKVGAGSGTSLIPNEGLFRIEIYVGEGLSGNVYYIYRSNDGQNWSLNTPDSTCTLDAGLICAYYTDHLSYFTTVQVNDTTPNSFSFTSLNNVELNTQYESATVTIQGMTATSNFTVQNGQASVNGGAYTTSGTINNGDTLKLRNTSSTNYNYTVTTTITIGAAQGTFQITTKQQPTGGGNGGGGGGGAGGIGGTGITWNVNDNQTQSGGKTLKKSNDEYKVFDLKGYASKYQFNNDGYAKIIDAIRKYIERDLDIAIMLGFIDGKKYQYYNELNANYEKFVDALYKYDQGKLSKSNFRKQVQQFAKYLETFNEIKARLLIKEKIKIGKHNINIMKTKSVQVGNKKAVEKLLAQYNEQLGKKTYTNQQGKDLGLVISKILIGYIVAQEYDKGVGTLLLKKYIQEYNLLK